MTKPILVLGSSGQVGRALVSQLGEAGIGFDRRHADLEKPETILSLFEKLRPKAVINAAAYTAVDLAEKNETLAFQINGHAPGIMAQWCSKNGVPFIHYSTDYVYSGEGQKKWNEEDLVSPPNSYGRSKLEGERRIANTEGPYLIFRTSWVYDETGKNFLNTMLRLGRERESLQVVADQWGAPTYASHLARATLRALENAIQMPRFPTGIYHLCNEGETTWHEFATCIFEIAAKKGIELKVRSVQAIPSSAYPTPAKRPENSRLNLAKAERILGVRMPHWKIGLQECMERQ